MEVRMSPASKSKGAGTVFLVIIAFMAIAAGSAWIIHTVLNGKEIPFIGKNFSTPASEQAAPGTAQPASGGIPGSSEPAPSSPPPSALPGGIIVESLPGGSASEGSSLPGGPVAPPVTPTVDGAGGGGEASSGLLVVPGAPESASSPAGEDAVVRPAFVGDVAAFLAQNYWPEGTHPAADKGGITTASLRWANLRYGAELRSLNGSQGDAHQARNAILNYVLNPGMIGRLYSLYADAFVTALSREASARSVEEKNVARFLTAAEKKEMFILYAAYAARVASALERYADNPGIAARVEAYADASAKVEEANKAYIESSVAYESSMEGQDKSAMTVARLKRDKDAATYQKRIRERESAHDALVAAMSRDGKVRRNDDTLVYVAFWSYRRGPNSAPGLRACAKALSDMSAKLSSASKGL